MRAAADAAGALLVEDPGLKDTSHGQIRKELMRLSSGDGNHSAL